MLDIPDPHQPTTTERILLPDHKSVDIPKSCPSFKEWDGEPVPDSYGGKPRVSPKHIANVKHRLIQLAEWCNFKLLRDLNRKPVDRWVKAELESQSPLSARTINDYLSTLSAMGNWCVGRATGVTARSFIAQSAGKGYRNRRAKSCTNACTNFRQSQHTGGNR